MAVASNGYITDVAYTNRYYEQLSPVLLNYLAALNGRTPRDLSDFDYCELGCGQGLSLVLHAGVHPEGRFVGIDLNPAHIDEARRLADEAALDNLTFLAESVSADAPLPQFDFITMHGLYSWVSDDVRQTLLKFAQNRLKPGGLLQVTYNALPGCGMRKPLRDVMRRFADPLSNDTLERTQLGLSYLRLMLNARVPFFQVNPELEKYAESLFKADLKYVAHEFFNDHWVPFGITQVASEMQGIGLEYAGSLPLWHNHTEADVPQNLMALFTPDTPRLVREAHKDFVYNTVFRSDLYVRADAATARAASRTDTIWNIPFGAAVPHEAVRFDVRAGTLQLPLNTRESRLIFSLLGNGARTPAELAEQSVLHGMTRDELVLNVAWWVLSGQVRPAIPAPFAARAQGRTRALNRALLKMALHDPDQDKATLASPLFGCGFPYDKNHALAVTAFADATYDTPGEQLGAMMSHCGVDVEEHGERINDDALGALAEELYGELETAGVLETARRQGLLA